MGENVEQFAVGLQSDGLRRVAIEQFVGAVAVVLGESGYGDAQPEFAFYHLAHHIHLPNTAVGDYQVGQRLLFFHHSGVSAAHHLLHRSIVVRASDGLYIVFPIVFFRWFHRFEHDAGSHCVCAGYVAVVEALNLEGQGGQSELLLKLFHQSRLALFGI